MIYFVFITRYGVFPLCIYLSVIAQPLITATHLYVLSVVSTPVLVAAESS